MWIQALLLLAAQETPCEAATPVKNPWTRGSPAGWWMKRHEETLTTPGRDKAQVAFIGDSITDGWDAEGAGLAAWTRDFAPLGALNLGINCDSTQHVLWRLEHGAVDGLPQLKVVVVMIGVNNKGINGHKGDDIAAGIAAICERLKKRAPQAKTLLLGVFPRAFGRDRNDDVNRIIEKLHDGKRVTYLNINDALLKGNGTIADRVGHLTAPGYEVWSAQIRPVLTKMME
jgi:lysophospholipase L1-like esterase